jgi:multidrug transporter EmrE-like cation transporter
MPITYTSVMAGIDIVSLSLVKQYSLGKTTFIIMIIAIVIYALQPILFLYALQFEGMAVVNLLWNLLSSVTVSLVGIWYFKEKLTPAKTVGAILSVIAIFLLSFDNATT